MCCGCPPVCSRSRSRSSCDSVWLSTKRSVRAHSASVAMVPPPGNWWARRAMRVSWASTFPTAVSVVSVSLPAAAGRVSVELGGGGGVGLRRSHRYHMCLDGADCCGLWDVVWWLLCWGRWILLGLLVKDACQASLHEVGMLGVCKGGCLSVRCGCGCGRRLQVRSGGCRAGWGRSPFPSPYGASVPHACKGVWFLGWLRLLLCAVGGAAVWLYWGVASEGAAVK